MIPKPNYPCVSARSLTHSQLLGWRQDDANASGFKVPLLFGGSSKEGIGGESRRAIFLNPQYSDGCQRGEREQREFWTPRTTFTALVISAAPSLVVKAIRPLVAFHRNKIPKPTLEASLLGADGVGQRGFRIIIRT